MTLTELAAKWRVEPIDAGLRIIRAGNSGGSVASFNMVESDIQAFMKQPWVVTSSDGSDGHPRQYASFPRKYVKYVVEDKVISLAEFIRSSTGRAADTYMLPNRGYLREGYFADVAVIDLDNYKPVAGYQRPRELASGGDATCV